MRVVVGRLGRANGVRGEVGVEVRTDAPEERFSPGAVLFLERDGVTRPVQVRSHRWQGARLVLSLEGVADRTAAEGLRGGLLLADVDVAAVADDEYHDLALIGLQVRDPEGQALGEVADVLHLPGQDILVVRAPDRPELLVPFVTAMVPVVDLAAGFLVADLPEGLAELGSS